MWKSWRQIRKPSVQTWESNGSNDDKIRLFNKKGEYELVHAVGEELIWITLLGQAVTLMETLS